MFNYVTSKLRFISLMLAFLIIMSTFSLITMGIAKAAVPIVDFSINTSFNGSSDYVGLDSSVSQVSSLTSGAIVVRFKSTNNAVAKALFSASSTSNQSSNLTLSVNKSNLYFELRENGSYLTRTLLSGNYIDNRWHTAVVNVDSTGTKYYVDGYEVDRDPSTAFFSSISNLNSMNIGRNVDNGGGEWYFAGDMNLVQVYNNPLSPEEALQLTAQTKYSDKTAPRVLFKPGMYNSNGYRIPSLITTTNGTLLAGIDIRRYNGTDAPNNIDSGIRRSTDNGETWDDIIVALDYPGTDFDGASAIDMSLLQDETTGTIFMLVDHFAGGVGYPNAVIGKGFDSNGYKYLYDYNDNNNATFQYTLRENGVVYNSQGQLTNYIVSENGDVTLNGVYSGNIYLKDGIAPQSLSVEKTAFLQILKSDDDGLTWSKAIDLNPSVKESWMKFIGTGPGRGIQLKVGANAGRLVFPIYFTNSHNMQATACIYSDDNGLTWKRGESPVDGKKWGWITLSAKTQILPTEQLTEAQVVELPNGQLKMWMRNYSTSNRIAVALSNDGGKTWNNNVYTDYNLPDPRCQLTAIKYHDLADGKTRILFANAADPNNRANGTVRLSEDGGNTWSYSKVITTGDYAYSCLTLIDDNTIGLLYEDKNEQTLFTKFTLDWLKSPN